MNKKVVYHTKLTEPVYEYFVTTCSWCNQELPKKYEEWYGNYPKPGDTCPHCHKLLAEEITENNL